MDLYLNLYSSQDAQNSQIQILIPKLMSIKRSHSLKRKKRLSCLRLICRLLVKDKVLNRRLKVCYHKGLPDPFVNTKSNSIYQLILAANLPRQACLQRSHSFMSPVRHHKIPCVYFTSIATQIQKTPLFKMFHWQKAGITQ